MNVLCPSCLGGRSKERSFHLYPDGSGKGRCYRASCGWKGSYDGLVPSAQPVIHTTARESLRSTHRHWLLSRVGPEVVRRLDAFSGGSRIGLPVLSPLGVDVGHVLRAVDGSRPKYVSEMPAGYKLGAWYGSACGADVVLVEDQLSAACIAEYSCGTLTAIALLGHALHQELTVELSKRNIATVKLALDRDAKHKAVESYLKARAILDIDLVMLPDDVKNLHKEQVLDILECTES